MLAQRRRLQSTEFGTSCVPEIAYTFDAKTFGGEIDFSDSVIGPGLQDNVQAKASDCNGGGILWLGRNW